MYRILRGATLRSQMNNFSVYEEIKRIPYFQDVKQKCNGDCNKVAEFVDCVVIQTRNDGLIVLVDKKGNSSLKTN